MKINEIVTETFSDSEVRYFPGRKSRAKSTEFTWGKHPKKGWVVKDPSGNVVFASTNTNQYNAREEVKAKSVELNNSLSEAKAMPDTNLKVGDKVTANTSKEKAYPGGHKSRSGTVTRVGQTGVHIKPDDGSEIEYHPYKIVSLSESWEQDEDNYDHEGNEAPHPIIAIIDQLPDRLERAHVLMHTYLRLRELGVPKPPSYEFGEQDIVLRYRMNHDLAKVNEEGVGIITKQNSTQDVNKSTPRKNLKAFKLVK